MHIKILFLKDKQTNFQFLTDFHSKEMVKKFIEFTSFALILSNDVVVVKTLGSSKISSKDLVSLNIFLNGIEVGALIETVYGP